MSVLVLEPICGRSEDGPKLGSRGIELEGDGQEALAGVLNADNLTGLLDRGFGIEQTHALTFVGLEVHCKETAMSIDGEGKGLGANFCPLRVLKVRLNGDLNQDPSTSTPLGTIDLRQKAFAFFRFRVVFADRRSRIGFTHDYVLSSNNKRGKKAVFCSEYQPTREAVSKTLRKWRKSLGRRRRDEAMLVVIPSRGNSPECGLQTAKSKRGKAQSTNTLVMPWFLPRQDQSKLIGVLRPDHRERMFAYFKRYGCIRCSRRRVFYSGNGLCENCNQLIYRRLTVCDKQIRDTGDKRKCDGEVKVGMAPEIRWRPGGYAGTLRGEKLQTVADGTDNRCTRIGTRRDSEATNPTATR